MGDYYDYTPLVQLERHVALAGYLSDETRVIAYRLAALTGLPVTSLDRTIEHFAGMSVWKLIRIEGEDRYRQLEREHLAAVVAAAPASILALGDGTLLDADNRRLLLERTHLVALDLDLPNCFWRLQANPAVKDFWHPLYPGPLEQLEQLRPFHAARRPGLAAAPQRVDLRGKDVGDAVEALQAMLPQL